MVFILEDKMFPIKFETRKFLLLTLALPEKVTLEIEKKAFVRHKSNVTYISVLHLMFTLRVFKKLFLKVFNIINSLKIGTSSVKSYLVSFSWFINKNQ